MIRLADVILKPTELLIEVIKKKSKVELLTIQFSDKDIPTIAKQGDSVYANIPVKVGDGIVLPNLKGVDVYTFEDDNGVEKEYFLIDVYQIIFAINNGTGTTLVKETQPSEFPDPNVTSPALDHVKV